MSIRMQLTPDDFLRAKLVKPGWYATLIKTVVEELNSKKDANNVVLDCENADPESEFRGVPVKHWLSEKGVSMAGGAVSLAKAFDPKMKEDAIAEVEFEDKAGRRSMPSGRPHEARMVRNLRATSSSTGHLSLPSSDISMSE
jgi:hypothetical protein